MKKELINDEWQIMWVLAREGTKAIEFKGGYENYWFGQSEVEELNRKLGLIDDSIREERGM